LLNKVR